MYARQWYERLMKVGFYADGLWHEGTPAYHLTLRNLLTIRIPRLLEVRSAGEQWLAEHTMASVYDPAWLAGFAEHSRRVNGALTDMVLPDGRYLARNDSPWDMTASVDDRPSSSASRLLGCAGHAALAGSSADGPVELHLDFGGTDGHEHYDCLNMTLFAEGREMFSETTYRAAAGCPEQWVRATAAHNTVVIDETDQNSRFNGPAHPLSAIDQVPGMPLTWDYRNEGEGNSLNNGRLLLYSTSDSVVKVVEAEGQRLFRQGLHLPTDAGACEYGIGQ